MVKARKRLKKDDSESDRSMRAVRDIEIGTELYDPIYPIAAALNNDMLQYRCSACFNHLPPKIHQFPCPNSCKGSVSYCTQQCRDLDIETHINSGECRLLALVNQGTITQNYGGFVGGEIRLAFRLFHYHYVCGSLLNCSGDHRRIGNLITNHHLLLTPQDDDDTAVAIKKVAELMREVRITDGGYETVELAEEMMLCQSVTNCIEVGYEMLSEVEEGNDFHRLFKRKPVVNLQLGAAIYGPLFSWCNHSCRPNAIFQNILKSQSDYKCNKLEKRGKIGCLIEADIMEYREISQQKMYGPAGVLRAISKLSKGDQIFVSYITLLCSTEARQDKLWKGYRFLCHCERCDNEFQSFADRYKKGQNSSESIPLASDAVDSSPSLGDMLEMELQMDADELNKNPEAFCQRLENQLRKCMVHTKRMQTRQRTSNTIYKLNPFHFVCLKVYADLANAYSVLTMKNSQLYLDGKPTSPEICLRTSKAAAAYSLLKACGVHYHVSSGERGLIGSAWDWMNAGEDILRWVAEELNRSHSMTKKSLHSIIRAIQVNLKCNCLLPNRCTKCLSICQHDPDREGDAEDITHAEVLLKDSESFLSCIKKFLTKLWPTLREGIFFLEAMPNPVDYNWFVGNGVSSENDATGSDIHESSYLEVLENVYLIDENKTERYRLDKSKLTALLCAVHCLLYSKYLFVISNGAENALVKYITSLF